MAAGFFNTVPFGAREISIHGSQYLGISDIGRMGKVCRKWRDCQANALCDVVWKHASLHDKIPIVDGERASYKSDLQIIRPLVFSVHGLFGRVLGPVPRIHPDLFSAFISDARERFGQGYFRLNFKLFVDPSLIERVSGPDFPFRLEEDGTLVEVEGPEREVLQQQTLLIKASWSNLLMLAKYPIKRWRKYYGEVYSIGEEVLKAIREQRREFPDKVGLHVQREYPLDATRPHNFGRQCEIIEETAPGEGYSPVDSRQRFLFDVECVLRTGTCPDKGGPDWTEVRGREAINRRGTTRHLVVGCFTPGEGVLVYDTPRFFDSIAAVPACPAEVLGRLALRTLKIGPGV